MATSRTAEPLESRHYVDADGKYWGAVGGLRIVEIETPETVEVPAVDVDGKPVLGKDGAPVVRVEQPAPVVIEREEWPEVPAGAIEVPAPPVSHLDTWDGEAWVSPALAVIAASKRDQARDRIASNPEFSALIDAVAERLSIASEVLRADVAGRIAAQEPRSVR